MEIITNYDSSNDPYPRHPHTKQTMFELYSLTKKREEHLKSLNYEVVTIWECDFKHAVSQSQDLTDFVNNVEIKPRLEPRNALFGGRVNASQLYATADGVSSKIAYADVTSLYPACLKYDRYPVGFPQIILNPDSCDISDYFGLVYCKVRAPRGLEHPVLPMRTSDKKLLFSLCKKCAETRPTLYCNCDNSDRDLEGTWCTIELENALEHGYEIVQIFEIYHFKETTTELFSGYVNLFLKKKQEASGWPRPNMSVEEKEQYLKEYLAAESIALNPDCIEYNSGIRQAAKCILVSLWGKFTESRDHRSHELVNNSADFYKLYTDPAIVVKDVHVLSENTAQIEYVYKDGHTPECAYINLFIGIFTTAHARTRLHKQMSRINSNCIYFDTDSIVYQYDPSDSNAVHPPYGDHLGQWTYELDDLSDYITQFVSAGPKSYAYITAFGKKIVKIKGLTLNYSALLSVNFESIKALVLHYVDPEIYPLPEEMCGESRVTVTYPSRIKRNRQIFQLTSEKVTKQFRVTYGKRMLLRDGSFKTIPFGY
jgi:hypothetical protein